MKVKVPFRNASSNMELFELNDPEIVTVERMEPLADVSSADGCSTPVASNISLPIAMPKERKRV